MFHNKWRVYILPGRWGLPSLHPSCLTLDAFGKIFKCEEAINFDISRSPSLFSQLDIFPFVVGSEGNSSGFQEIVKEWEDDVILSYSKQEKANMEAYIRLFLDSLHPVLMFALWLDSSVLSRVMRHACCAYMPIAMRWIYPILRARNLKIEFEASYYSSRSEFSPLSLARAHILERAIKCISLFSSLADSSESDFILGTKSTLDALLMGYLGWLHRLPRYNSNLENERDYGILNEIMKHLEAPPQKPLSIYLERLSKRLYPLESEDADSLEAQFPAILLSDTHLSWRSVSLFFMTSVLAITGYAAVIGFIKLKCGNK